MALMIESVVGSPPSDAGEITKGLVAFNAEAADLPRPEAMTVIVRDGENGPVVAGLRGKFTRAGCTSASCG